MTGFCEPTEAGLSCLVKDGVPAVKNVRIRDLGDPGCFIVLITMKWWAWLTFGWHHRRAKKRAHNLVDCHRAAGTKALIEVVVG